jgi:phosphoribosyl 1,2-cyclic phosphodiesterase
LDAGTGIRRASALFDGTAFDGAILLGHLHWDHTQGLPFFGAGDDPGSRVDLYSPAQGDTEVVLGGVDVASSFPDHTSGASWLVEVLGTRAR